MVSKNPPDSVEGVVAGHFRLFTTHSLISRDIHGSVSQFGTTRPKPCTKVSTLVLYITAGADPERVV